MTVVWGRNVIALGVISVTLFFIELLKKDYSFLRNKRSSLKTKLNAANACIVTFLFKSLF